MTDNEIIKALELCVRGDWGDCKQCPLYGEEGSCKYVKDCAVLDLINRQKAEIERLQIENESLRMAANSFKMHYTTARAEAIKEFAERLKRNEGRRGVPIATIDNIAKEMTGGLNYATE